MATMKVFDIKAALRKKGFVEEANRDHVFFTFFNNGMKTSIRTKISHGEKDIRDPLIKAMSKQVHLDKSDFTMLVECPLTEDAYKAKLIKDGVITVE